MEKIIEFFDINRKKIIAGVLFAIISITLFVGVYFFNAMKTNADSIEFDNNLSINKSSKNVEKTSNIEENSSNKDIVNVEDNINSMEDSSKIKVDIKGAVKKPGVYELNINNRVIDVIKKAGGLKSNASTDNINLSKKIYDEMVIIVNSNKKQNYEIENDADINNTKNSPISTNKNTVSTKININTAELNQLITLTGIGEAKAKAIIEYRKSKKFNSIDDIKNVTGIGDALFEKIKNNITV